MTKYNNKVIWTYVTRVFSFFTLSTFLPFLKISENNIKRLWTYLKCPFSGHRIWSETDNIIKRKSYIIHNIWPSEFVITGEGTVINFPYIQLPFINCNNKGSICSSKAFLWFPLVSFLLFFFLSRFGCTVLVGFIKENSFQLLQQVAGWNEVLKHLLHLKQAKLQSQTLFGLIEWTACNIIVPSTIRIFSQTACENFSEFS